MAPVGREGGMSSAVSFLCSTGMRATGIMAVSSARTCAPLPPKPSYQRRSRVVTLLPMCEEAHREAWGTSPAARRHKDLGSAYTSLCERDKYAHLPPHLHPYRIGSSCPRPLTLSPVGS